MRIFTWWETDTRQHIAFCFGTLFKSVLDGTLITLSSYMDFYITKSLRLLTFGFIRQTRSLAFPIETPLKSTGVSQSTPHFSKYTRFSALKHLLPKKQMHKSQWAPAVHYNNFWSQKDKAHGDIQPCFTRFWSICMHELNGHLWTFCCSSLISQARRK